MPANDSAVSKLIPSLTGYRALAAAIVFFHHFNPFTDHDSLAFKIVNEGHLGVTMFFVLSGFLITYRYSDIASWSRQQWRIYLQNRLARIYPVLFFLTVVGFLITHEKRPELWVSALTMTKAWFDDFKFSAVGPAWSLSVEEVFYVLAPVLFFTMRRFGFFATLIACYATGLGLGAIGSNLDFYGLFNGMFFMSFFTFWGRAFEFLLGMELALRLKSGRLKAFTSFRYKTWIGAAGIFATMYILSVVTEDEGLKNATLSHTGVAINNLVLPPFIALLIWGLASEATWLNKALSTRTAILLGQSSYFFYLLQQSTLGQVVTGVGFGDNLTQAFPAMVILSLIFYQGLELPLHRKFRAHQATPSRDLHDLPAAA